MQQAAAVRSKRRACPVWGGWPTSREARASAEVRRTRREGPVGLTGCKAVKLLEELQASKMHGSCGSNMSALATEVQNDACLLFHPSAELDTIALLGNPDSSSSICAIVERSACASSSKLNATHQHRRAARKE